MEHIPSQDIDDVLGFIRSLSSKAFFNIDTAPAHQILPDGSNAHCSVFSREKWLEKIQKHFPEATLIDTRRRAACTIVTWPTILKTQLEKLDELDQLKRRLEKWRPSYRLNKLLRKFLPKK
jgi:hypothetical protein